MRYTYSRTGTRYVRSTKRLLLVFVFVILGIPVLSLTAYTPEHTFTVAPTELRMDVRVGESTTEQFTVAPDVGDFTYPTWYNVGLETAQDDHCLGWNSEETECVGGYDVDAWANDGLLCEYIELVFEGDENGTLQVPDDAEDTVGVHLSVPCVEGQCASSHSWPPPFPVALLDRELVCEVYAREPISISRVAPSRAYAQSATGDTVRVRAVVREVADAEATLTLPVETGYEGERGVVSSGPHPERGLADADTFTFKVVYTNSDDTAPDSQDVRVANMVVPMQVDGGADDAVLRDGRHDNGEQYVAVATLPHGAHTYEFVAQVGGEEVRLSEREDATLFVVTAGYSSVAFFPGLQASRLFEEGLVFENKLWEPNRDADARSLVMNEDGTSENPDIYTKPGPEGALDEAFGFTTNIYKSFLHDLADWKDEDGVIADYAVLPYDWRLAFDAVLGGGKVEDGKLYYDASYATDTPYIFSELERLVEGSDTGRVVLVGHSMGGLMIKKLLTDLEDDPLHPYRHLLGKVDTVVLVASPQLGTPKAVASFLHGFGQELDIPPFGIPNFATDDTLREIGRDMPSGYTLIPSEMYFDRVRDVGEDGVELSGTTVITGRGAGPVNSYDEMRDFFATDFGDAEDDIEIPLQPRSDFLDSAEVLHERIDGWYPPDLDADGAPDFRVVQIAGWGVTDTLKGVKYVTARRRVECPPGLTEGCYETYVRPEPLFTHEGDGTVVVPSAVAMGEESDEERGVETWYLDMYQYNRGLTTDRSHASVLEVNVLSDSVKNIIQHNDVDAPYMHQSTEELTIPDPQLRLAIHSPVAVRVRDVEGNEIGARLEDGVMQYDTEVPNSYYATFAESTYVGVPLDGEEYTVEFVGIGEGSFTLELVEEKEGKVLSTRTFTDVPVSPALRSSVVLESLEDVEVLSIDADGDGMVDTSITPDELISEPVTHAVLVQALSELNTPARHALIATARLSERFYTHNKARLAHVTLRLLEEQVTFWSSTKRPVKVRIKQEEAESLQTLINNLELTF